MKKSIQKELGNGKSSNKITLREFVWNGFNYTVTIVFASSFGVLTSGKDFPGLGLNLIWIWVLMALIAGTVAFAFAKLARQHNSKNNGAGYVYARTNLGRMTGLFVGFIQYVYVPFSLTYQLVSMIKSSLGMGYISKISGTDVYPWYVVDWGPFTYLSLDLIAIGIFILCSLTIFGGVRLFKKMANYSGFVKWGAFAFLFILAIALAFTGGKTNIEDWANNSHLSYTGFVTAFNSCFLAFAGFEVFSTAGKNIENPAKNISKGIILVMIFSALFYIVTTILFLFAFTSFSQNINMYAWAQFMDSPNLQWLYYLGPIVMLIGMLGLRVNSLTQKSFYAGTIVQPLCAEGYLPEKFAELSPKDNMSVKASMLNIIITLIVACIWLIIPDIISGVSGATSQSDDIFRINDFQSMATAICLFVYIMAMISIMKLGAEGKLKITVIEWIAYGIATLCLIFFFESYYQDHIVNIINGINDNTKQVAMIRSIIAVSFSLLCIAFFYIWYAIYYRPKQKQRSVEYQTKLDNEFLLSDDWFVVKDYVTSIIESQKAYKQYASDRLYRKSVYALISFQERNKKIYGNTKNPNYIESQKLLNQVYLLK